MDSMINPVTPDTRYLIDSELQEVWEALLKMKEKAAGRNQMKFVDLGTAHTSLAAAYQEQRIVMVGGYAIMFQVGSPWYSDKKYLIEDIILKVYDWTPYHVSLPIAALYDLAAARDCVCVATGDTQVGYLDKHYLGAGYVRLGSQFFKEIPDGIRP